ncbi:DIHYDRONEOPTERIN ALDOLASE 1-RELATED [Salix koriyanagi]|uniref:7,8-dihydroneopterin aldolase n=1 Tax=Salix koriyanagi TaxID=2511006 RepID=A0A9Q0X5R2_9ROSI|nr:DIHYDRONEOPTERIN ALDOLASE 1-RELATED [Salix koriyanagi]
MGTERALDRPASPLLLTSDHPRVQVRNRNKNGKKIPAPPGYPAVLLVKYLPAIEEEQEPPPFNRFKNFHSIWPLTSHSTSFPIYSVKKRRWEMRKVRGGDKLILRGLKFHGFHGVKPEERALGQKFLIDVDAWMDLRAAGKSDCLSDTVSYTEIYRIAKEIAEGPPQNLLESVAQQIASTTLSRYPQISAVRVKVGKPHVAVHGILDYLGVEILRHRSSDLPS